MEDDMEFIPDSIKIILEKKLERSFDELSQELNLWKAIHQDCNLPMRTYRYLKLHIISKQNLMKPLSNTIIKIIDSICAALPVNGSQVPAIFRLLKYCACDFMKMHQACTAKNIGDYSSAQAQRNSALHRMQYLKYAEKLAVHYLTNEFAENLRIVTPSRESSSRRTRIRKMNEVKKYTFQHICGRNTLQKKIRFLQSGRGTVQHSNTSNDQVTKRIPGCSSIVLAPERIRHQTWIGPM